MDLQNMREWAPLSELIDQIPVKAGLLKSLNLTCISATSNFIALGTDSGVVIWYDRATKELQKLRTESSVAVLTCVQVVDSVQNMVAAGDDCGRIVIFQIEKKFPPELAAFQTSVQKPIKRYTVSGCHKSYVTCVQWSKNGMRLFSGDKSGVVVLTEIDYQAATTRSREILNESYEIIQISWSSRLLSISTMFRSVVAQQEEKSSTWKVTQIGKRDRKALCKLGAAFFGSKNNPTVVAARPGYRFWVANPQDGEVSQTLVFKEAVGKVQTLVPLLNPAKYPAAWMPLNFGLVYPYGENRIITSADNVVYILNLKELVVDRVIQHLRGVVDLSICYPEIFILEASRSVIRVAPEPENAIPLKKSMVDFPLWKSDDEVDSEAFAAEDLPPLAPFSPEILSKKLEEAQLKLRQFNQISLADDPDPILYESRGPKTSGTTKSRSQDRSRKTSRTTPEPSRLTAEELEHILATPTLIDVSMYESCMEPSTKEDRAKKERDLAEKLDIQPIVLEPLELPPKVEPIWTYPTAPKDELVRPFRRLSLFEDPVDDSRVMESNLSDDMKLRTRKDMSKSMYDQPTTPIALTDYISNIPSLWNRMERVEEGISVVDQQQDNSEADWEFI